jgi:hypothetical protein
MERIHSMGVVSWNYYRWMIWRKSSWINLTNSYTQAPSLTFPPASRNDYGQRMTLCSSVALLPNKQILSQFIKLQSKAGGPFAYCNRRHSSHLGYTLAPDIWQIHRRLSRLCRAIPSFLNCRLRCQMPFDMRLRVVMNLSLSCPDTTIFGLSPEKLDALVISQTDTASQVAIYEPQCGEK